jgi:NitT/TauT family transport system substrate-binding protein
MNSKALKRSVAIGLMTIGFLSLWLDCAWTQELSTVRVTVGQRGNWDTTMAFMTGEKEGFFTKEGIKLDIFYTKGGAETLQPVSTGNAEFGWANGTFGVLGAYEKGAKIKIVSASFTGVDLFWYVKGDSPYRKFQDLAGKKVGFSSVGSSTHLVLLRMAELAGVKLEAVAIGGIPDNYTAVMTGQIAAGWAVPPQRVDEIKKGMLRVIARGADFPELQGITFRVNIANADYLKKNPAVARAFFRAYQKALDYNYENPKSVIPEFAALNKTSLEIAEESLKFFPRKGLELAPVAGLEYQVEKAVEFGFLKKKLTQQQLDDLVDLSYLPK